jgi:predicted dehydrogenase
MIDAVIIAVPPKFHASIAAKFLMEGVSVMIEKPLTLSMKDADLLLELEHKTGTPILVNHTQLFHPAYFKVREIIAQWMQQGNKIHCIRLQSGAFGPFRKSWTVLWDWSPHDVALALDMIGLVPDAVSALGNDHSVMISLTFANGCEVHIANSNIASHKHRCYGVYSDKEIIYFDDIAEEKLCRVSLQSFSPMSYVNKQCLPITYAHAHTKPLTNALEYFVDGLRGGNTKKFGLDLGVNVVRILSRAQDSLNGHPIR